MFVSLHSYTHSYATLVINQYLQVYALKTTESSLQIWSSQYFEDVFMFAAHMVLGRVRRQDE